MIREDLRTALQQALLAAGLPEPPNGIVLDPPKAREHGDWSSPVALSLAKIARAAPLEIAGQVRDALNAARVPHLERVEVAPPGFVNLYLAPTWLHDVLKIVVKEGDRFGTSDVLQDRRINLEFVSVNPTGPLHAGGGRWIAVGDSLANLLAAQGAEVHREYYLNDAGNQLNTFRDSLFARYQGAAPPEDGYQGQYLVDLATELRAELGDDVEPDAVREWGLAKMVDGIKADLGRIGVHFDTWF
jgi:arginyl-tRNA synthetase